MTFEEWYEANVEYMNIADFKPWISEAWDAAVLAERERIFKEYGIDPKKNETNS